MLSLMQNQVVKNASPPMKHSIPFKKFYNAKLDIIPIVLKYPANVKKKTRKLYHYITRKTFGSEESIIMKTQLLKTL